jgi:hypothetical protein
MENLNFKEWIEYSNVSNENDETKILNLYFQTKMKIKEISQATNVSVGDIYRILHKFGKPNRKSTNHENVLSFAKSNLPINKIAEFTGYSPRNIRYILRKKQ